MKIPREQVSQYLQRCDENEALEPIDRRYVSLEDFERDGERVTIRGGDWIQPLFDCIDLAGGKATAQLFSGYLGTGKSTELRRLKARLEEAGYVVLLADAERYHDLSHPLLIQDLLVLLAGTFGEQTAQYVGEGVLEKSYWERLRDFLMQEVTLDKIKIPAGAIDIQASLRHGEAKFWRDVQQALASSLGRLGQHVHGYVGECLQALRQKLPDKRGVVFILDSLERLRGEQHRFIEIMEGVGRVFDQHAELLHLPGCHCIYTVPPYAKLIRPNLARRYSLPVHHPMPAVKVTQKSEDLIPYQDGIDRLIELVGRRIPISSVFGERRDLLEKLVLFSGGHVRTLINFVRLVLIYNVRGSFPPSEELIDRILRETEEELRISVRPDGIPLLDSIRRTAALAEVTDEQMPTLARYIDTNLVLCYRNGEGWYEVHPLIRRYVEERMHGNSATAGEASEAEPDSAGEP